MTTTLLAAPSILATDHELHDGWLLVRDGIVADAGDGTPPPADAREVLDGVVVPGFVDQHEHGAVGADLGSGSADELRRAVAFHRGTGTTTLLASVATGTPGDTRAAVARLRALAADGTIAGIHLEGPWLAHGRRGAHAPALLRAPDPAEIDRLLATGEGTIRMVTLAPELPGALDAVRRLVAEGVVVALGHTEADASTMTAAIDEGARVVTHVFNGMPPLHHRAPGPVGVALTDPRLTVEVIADGHHLDPIVLDLVRSAVGERMALVSDTMAGTGLADGRYALAGSDVVVADGVAMLADGSSLAGSTTPLAGGVAALRARGATWREIVHASSVRAATTLGLAVPLAVGSPADLVVLDPATAAVRRVMKGGAWPTSSS